MCVFRGSRGGSVSRLAQQVAAKADRKTAARAAGGVVGVGAIGSVALAVAHAVRSSSTTVRRLDGTELQQTGIGSWQATGLLALEQQRLEEEARKREEERIAEVRRGMVVMLNDLEEPTADRKGGK